MATPNPFEVLRLDPTASEEEVVRQAGRLRQRAADEATQNAIRQAVQALTGRAEERVLHALLTHPRPGHHAPALDRFMAAFRRAPAPTEASPCPTLDTQEFLRLLLLAAAEELQLAPPPFETPPGDEPPEEIQRQMAEALWQSLLFDSRA